MARCVEICLTCYHACAAASLIMSAGSEYAKKLLGLVAEICEDCAEECEKHQHAEYCRLTAESCRKCADECCKIAGQK